MHTAPALGGGSAAEPVGRRALVSQRAGEEEQEGRSGSQGRGKIKVETLGVSVAPSSETISRFENCCCIGE